MLSSVTLHPKLLPWDLGCSHPRNELPSSCYYGFKASSKLSVFWRIMPTDWRPISESHNPFCWVFPAVVRQCSDSTEKVKIQVEKETNQRYLDGCICHSMIRPSVSVKKQHWRSFISIQDTMQFSHVPNRRWRLEGVLFEANMDSPSVKGSIHRFWNFNKEMNARS